MTDWVKEILNRHGQLVTLCLANGDANTRAFLQPVTERREQVPDEMTALGTIDGRLWLYLGRTAVDVGDRILWNDMAFQVRSSRPYYEGEKLLYWWAAVEPAKEAAE